MICHMQHVVCSKQFCLSVYIHVRMPLYVYVRILIQPSLDRFIFAGSYPSSKYRNELFWLDFRRSHEIPIRGLFICKMLDHLLFLMNYSTEHSDGTQARPATTFTTFTTVLRHDQLRLSRLYSGIVRQISINDISSE